MVAAGARARIKAIVVDLDGTLYQGVLGEDRLEDLQVTPSHVAIHEALHELRSTGIFLVLCSRNDPADVDGLFRSRDDLRLSAADFAYRAVSWDSKLDSIVKAAAKLRIAPDALLFLDDNPGEIAAVAAGADIRCLLAGNPAEVSRALRMYPALVGYETSDADRLRIVDIEATNQRQVLAAAAIDPKAYVRSLEVKLTFSVDRLEDLARLAQLSNKTNQFNTGLLRMSEVEIARRFGDEGSRTVSVTLADRLSDAGLIGAVFASRDGAELVVDEIAISCRALGRGVEDFMICAAIVRAAEDLGLDRVRIRLSVGPRNEPARTWVQSMGHGGATDGAIPVHDFANRAKALGDIVTASWA